MFVAARITPFGQAEKKRKARDGMDNISPNEDYFYSRSVAFGERQKRSLTNDARHAARRGGSASWRIKGHRVAASLPGPGCCVSRPRTRTRISETIYDHPENKQSPGTS